MNGEKVLLLELRERTSAAGNRYLSGWLGKASVVAFLDRDADEPTWQVFVSTPSPRPAGGAQPVHTSASRSRSARKTSRPSRAARTVPPGVLDDDISDLRGTT